MQEVFEKIIEKLEEYSVLRPNSKEFYNNPQNGEYVDNVVLFRDAIEIVKKEAEKCNNGWIPCSERLPEKIGRYYIVSVKSTISELCYARPALYDKDGFATKIDEEVIAWQPLPEPYQTNICDASDCPFNDGMECPAAEGCAGYEPKGE